jgi:hypothetical protein
MRFLILDVMGVGASNLLAQRHHFLFSFLSPPWHLLKEVHAGATTSNCSLHNHVLHMNATKEGRRTKRHRVLFNICNKYQKISICAFGTNAKKALKTHGRLCRAVCNQGATLVSIQD